MRKVPDFTNAKTVCYREIGKGPAPIDRAVVGRRLKSATSAAKSAGWHAKEIAAGKASLVNGPWPNTKYTDLSIEAEKNEALYLIGLGTGTGCRFGPSSNPIQLFPIEWTGSILKDVGLIFQDVLGNDVFVDAADIPAQYGSIPASAMLAFTLDRKDLETAWNSCVTSAGHTDYTLKVPFFLNLYDVNTGLPIWAFGDPNLAAAGSSVAPKGKASAKMAAGGGNGLQPMTHGGIHPGSTTQVFY